MTSAKRTAAKPQNLKVGDALDEVEEGGKVATAKDPKAFKLYPNSTFASRVKAQGKRVGAALNKAVSAEETKAK